MGLSQVQIHGGYVTDTITADTTHLVVDGSTSTDAQELTPLALMQAVASKLGGLHSLRLFKQAMLSGKLKLVSPRCCFILKRWCCRCFLVTSHGASQHCPSADVQARVLPWMIPKVFSCVNKCCCTGRWVV